MFGVAIVVAISSLIAFAQLAPLEVYEPGVAEGEIWQFEGTMGGSVQERCLDAGEGIQWELTDPHPCDDETPALQPDEMWEPLGLTVVETVDYDGDSDVDVDDYRAFGADRLNRRIVAFDFYGNHVATYSSFTRPDQTTQAFGFIEDIDADAAGNMIVSESNDSRLLVVDRNFHLLLEHVYENDGLPTNFGDALPGHVDIAPGTIFTPRDGANGTCGPARNAGRIVVTLWSPYDTLNAPEPGATITDMNTAVVYDSSLCRVTALGQENYAGLSTPGDFFQPIAPRVDRSGRIYVVDYNNSKIEVFEPDPLDNATYHRVEGLYTGDSQPVLGGSAIAPAQINGPYHLMEDAQDRVVVADFGNQRLAVYLPPWHEANPTDQWEFLFQLTGQGALAGAWPSAVQEDSYGRWLAVTAGSDRLFVFQKPELAVFGLTVEQDAATIRVDFNVAVPVRKPAASGVVALLDYTSVDGAVLTNRRGPYDARVVSGAPVSVPALSMQPGEYLPVYYLYDVATPGSLEFSASAEKQTDAGIFTAPAKLAEHIAVSPDCERVRPTVSAQVVPRAFEPQIRLSDNAPIYGNEATISFAAADADSAIREIRYVYVEGRYTGRTGALLPDEHGGFPVITLWDNRSGPHSIRYWAVDACGNRSDVLNDSSDDTVIRILIDTVAPLLAFGTPTPSTGTLQLDPNGRAWSNAADVTIAVTTSDDDTFGNQVEFEQGGEDRTATGSILHFTSEGLGQARFVVVTDPVGNRMSEWSYAPRTAGGPEVFVNIDRTPPALTFHTHGTPDGQNGWWTSPVTITATATDVQRWSGIASFVSPQTANLPVCTAPETAPGLLCFRQTLTATFSSDGAGQFMAATAQDYAGNTTDGPGGAQRSTAINIDRTPPSTAAQVTGNLVSGRYDQPVQIALTTTDATSGPAATLYSDTGPAGPWQTYTGPITRTTSGAIWFKGSDVAGNESAVGSQAFIINRAPHASAITASLNEDTAALIALLEAANDPDGDTLSVVAVSSAAHGMATLEGGALRYIPAPNFHGVDQVTYRVTDGSLTASAVVTITVVSVNDAPTAVNQVARLIRDTTTVIPVLTGASDPDGDALTVVSVTDPENGTAVIVGGTTVSYTPDLGYFGLDSFSFTISDGHGGLATATVQMIANQAPTCGTARGGEIWPPNHTRFFAAPIWGVTDPEGLPVTIVVTRILQDEKVDDTGDGRFAPDAQGIGTSAPWLRAERNGGSNGRVYEIHFTATDAQGESCTGNVFYTVPNSQGQSHSTIDNGVRYDATGAAPGAVDKPQTHRKSGN